MAKDYMVKVFFFFFCGVRLLVTLVNEVVDVVFQHPSGSARERTVAVERGKLSRGQRMLTHAPVNQNQTSCCCHSDSALLLLSFKLQTESNSVHLPLSDSSTEVHHGKSSLHLWKGAKSLDGGDLTEQSHSVSQSEPMGVPSERGKFHSAQAWVTVQRYSGDSGWGAGNAFEHIVTSLPLADGRHMPSFFI